jgi:mannobiose 2-epimerase
MKSTRYGCIQLALTCLLLGPALMAAENLSTEARLTTLRDQARQEVFDGILSFWLQKCIDPAGGFYGRVTNAAKPVADAPKGLVLNSRILWTFSAAYNMTNRSMYLKTADRAYEYLTANFLDKQNGGYYWMLDAKGKPVDDKFELYGMSFVVYSLAEYSSAAKSKPALEQAVKLFDLIQAKCHDPVNGGYFESFNRDWSALPKSTMAYGIDGGVKTMNTHLHLLEAFTTLYRVYPEPKAKAALQELMDIFYDHILDPDKACCRLFFETDWKNINDTISFGHDIEAAWLLCDAADALGDAKQIEKTRAVAVRIADAVLKRGLDKDGGLLYEANPDKITNPTKDWWPQAETLVGMFNAWQISKEPRFLDATLACWEFTQKSIIDKKYGDWYFSAAPSHPDDALKVSEWKAPYHNGRACMELVKRIK